MKKRFQNNLASFFLVSTLCGAGAGEGDGDVGCLDCYERISVLNRHDSLLIH